jgi:hypothetical protein
MVAGLIGFAISGGFGPTASAQAPQCRLGTAQTPQETQRRAPAVNFVRAVANAQVKFMSENGRYGTLEELSGMPDLSTGTFATSLIATAKQYSILVKDSSDPCGYTLFSDQRGLIFIGAPMQ